MSKKETQNTEQKQEKIITSYDRKMQRREEQKKKEQREKHIMTAVGIVIAAALVCLIASFPIRTLMATRGTFIKVGGENVTRVEFDYAYNIARNNYLAQYGTYMSYFGLDLSGDLSTQMYSETLTWQDYFEQLAVENLISNKALKDQAEAAGFTYDTTEEYADFEESVENAASEAGLTTRDYVRQLYGSYATLSRISDFVKEAMVINQYYEQIAEERAPSEEEIQSYYEENTDSYDSVDYRIVTIEAQLPTEPTELADPAEEETSAEEESSMEDTQASTEDAQASAETDAAQESAADETGTEEEYEPSEAEIAAAMEEAQALAQDAQETVAQDGELQENVQRASANSLIRDWLFDASREAGDTTIIEDADNNRYFVLAFEERYLDETPSVDVRVLITQEEDGQALLDEWASGEATEETFGALCEQYSTDTSTAGNGGLYEGVTRGGLPDDLDQWLFEEGRAAGDTVSITSEDDGYTYVMYYVGQNDPAWKLSVRSTLLSETMTAYMEEISAGIEVEDSKGNLNYLKVEAEASAAETSTAEDSSSVEGTETAQTGEIQTEEIAQTEETQTEETAQTESTQTE